MCAAGLLSKRSLPLLYHFPGLPHDRLETNNPSTAIVRCRGFNVIEFVASVSAPLSSIGLSPQSPRATFDPPSAKCLLSPSQSGHPVESSDVLLAL